MGRNTRAEWVTAFPFQGDTAGILVRLNSQTTHSDCFSPACGCSKSSGILEQTLIDGDDYSLQIVVTSWNFGENSSNFLLPGEDKVITGWKGSRVFNPPSPPRNGVMCSGALSAHPIFPMWVWTLKGSTADG